MNLRIILSATSLCLFSAVTTAQCVDDPEGWVDGASGPGYDCETYALGQWCTIDGGQGVGWNRNNAFGWGRISWNGYKGTNNKKFDEACCACGGGTTNGDGYTAPEYDHTDYVFTQEDKENAPGRRAKKKISVGEEWVDLYGYSCRVYKSMNFCVSDGTVGDGWDNNAWGAIESYENGGRNCFTACEVCGWDGE